MKDIRKKPYRLHLGLIPKELINKKFKCPKCGNNNTVPWLEKMNFPAQPIALNSGVGHCVPAGFNLKCSSNSCDNIFIVNIPQQNRESKWTLYGDEAGRFIENNSISNDRLFFFCITLVGLHNKKEIYVQQKINQLKKSINPSQNPEEWQHHFKDIWTGNSSSKQFNLSSKKSKIEYAKKFASIIRNARPELVSFNTSGCIILPKDKKERKKHMKYQKENIFNLSLLTSLQQMRQNNKSVCWIFDNIQDTTNGNRTEGWASECFLGLQYTRLFTWLSSGSTVLEPRFVTPGSHVLLEIADFISFWTAREFYKYSQNQHSEISTRLLGECFYHGIIGDGSVKTKWSRGLPLKDFYA